MSDSPLSIAGLVSFYVRLLGTCRRRFLLLLFGIFCLSFYSLVPPLILGAAVNTFVFTPPDERLLHIVLLSLLFGALFVLTALLRLNLKNAYNSLRVAIGYQIRVSGFEELLRKNALNASCSSGEDTQKLLAGVNDFYELTWLLSRDFCRFAAGFIGSILVFLVLAPQFVLFFLGYFVLFSLLLGHFSRRLAAVQFAAAKAAEQAAGTVVDSLSNLLTVRGQDAARGFAGRLAGRATKVKVFEEETVRLSTLQWKYFQSFTGVSLAAVLWHLGSGALSGRISPGLLITFFGYFQALAQNCSDLMDIWEGLQKRRAGLSRLSSILRAAEHGGEAPAGAGSDWKAVTFEHVCYRYQGAARDALHGISFELRRGERAGITGPSGSGKSTLARLLCGLIEPASGSILVDGSPLSGIHPSRSGWAFAFQECELFSMTLRENITLMREIAEDDLERSLQICGIGDIAARLPAGLDTPVGEKGYSLSGGERQRISIARAACRRPSLLVLDEAGSMLDQAAEESILEGLNSFLPDALMVIISHHERSFRLVQRRIALPARS